MTESRIWKNEEEIFDLARRIDDPDVRASYLEQACEGNDALEARVRELLSINSKDDSLLDRSPVVSEPTISISQEPIESEGQRIGPYELLQQLGEGGFGVVFMAQQLEPVRRKVALKIIKPGMESKDVVARFEAERQALALMNHPNIASVFDGGCTPSGRPYFVMELVRGVSITEYCDKRNLPPQERIELFRDVCSAIQHAHQKGVIHRDLKPSNVMVTLHDGQPVVKVIDFGVAKAINQQLTDKMYFTRYGQMIGTPQYMSPEQAEMSGLGIDTLSDIYSLGVLLYELLVGTTPISQEDLREAGFQEMRRLICDVAPALPSQRLSTTGQQELADIASRRSVSAEKLTEELRGDLEWIVMKTLEKERDRRYATPLELSRDLQRFLNSEPIEARPPSFSYRLSKYVRRHRGLAASLVVIASSIFVTAIFSSFMWRVAASNREAAEDSLQKVQIEKAKTSEALEESRRLTRLAENQSRELEKQVYAAFIREAETLVRNEKYFAANEKLDACPERLRSWEWQVLREQAAQAPSNFEGQHEPLFFADDDRVLTIARYDDSLKIWDTKTGERLREIHVTGLASLTSAALHPNQTLVIAGDKQGQIYSIDLENEEITRLNAKAHIKRVDGIGFSPDGSKFASAGWDGQLVLWDTNTLTTKTSRSIDDHRLRCIEFDSTGQYVATTASNGETCRLEVRDAETLDQVKTIELEGDGIGTVHFSPNGELLAAGNSRSASVWAVKDWSLITTLPELPGRLLCLRFGPHGNQLAASGDEYIQLWDWRESLLKDSITNRGGKNYWLNFSHRGDKLAVYDGDKNVLMRRITDDGQFQSPRRDVIGLPHKKREDVLLGGTFSADGERFAAAGTDRTIYVWDVATRKLTRYLNGHQNLILDLIWNEKYLLSRDSGGYVACWDANGTPVWMRRLEENETFAMSTMAVDGDRLYFGTAREGIDVYDVASCEKLETIETDGGTVSAIALSRDGQWLAWSNDGSGIKLLNLEQRDGIETIPTHGETLRSIAFSADQKLIAAADSHWFFGFDRKSKNEIFREHSSVQLWKVGFTMTGNRLIVSPGAKSSFTHVYDGKSGDHLLDIYRDPGAWTFAYDFNRDRLATFDKEIRLIHSRPPLSADDRHTTVQAVAPIVPYNLIRDSKDLLFNDEKADDAEALKLAEEGVQHVQNCAEYRAIQGIALHRVGRHREAIGVLERVETVEWQWNVPEMDDLKVHALVVRALAHQALGERERALETLGKARSLSNDVLLERRTRLAFAEANQFLDE